MASSERHSDYVVTINIIPSSVVDRRGMPAVTILLEEVLITPNVDELMAKVRQEQAQATEASDATTNDAEQ